MTFAAPLFLLAALAGLIPVFVHLIHRQKARVVHYSTLRFLRISVQRTRRRKYIEDMSLLAVRVAVLLLIAVGLARPALSSLATLWGGGRTAAIAIVLDNSASTDRPGPRSVPGQSRCGRAGGPGGTGYFDPAAVPLVLARATLRSWLMFYVGIFSPQPPTSSCQSAKPNAPGIGIEINTRAPSSYP